MDDKELFRLAADAIGRAYTPYSGFKVGAALLTADGKVYQGANIENSSYGATLCAERTAIAKAIYDGHRDFKAIAIAAKAPDRTTANLTAALPCGICRQFLYEFGADTRVIAGTDENHLESFTIGELLPKGFSLHP
jgi:cytidine deaminase